MKTLIVAATEAEIAPSIPTLEASGIDYLITGVGMVATAFTMGHHLAARSYDLLLNVGIAGTFSPTHALGSLFRITTDQIHLFGAENGVDFIPINELGFGQAVFREQAPDGGLSDELFTRLPTVDALTVNCVHGHLPRIQTVTDFYGTDLLESMEGASFFFAAQAVSTPRLQVRAVSNLVETRNRENWNIPLAIQTLNEWISSFANDRAEW